MSVSLKAGCKTGRPPGRHMSRPLHRNFATSRRAHHERMEKVSLLRARGLIVDEIAGAGFLEQLDRQAARVLAIARQRQRLVDHIPGMATPQLDAALPV